ncbi:MAG: GNAT family N-acetyltransferase [Coriobacteriales bacterium]|jgi:RimJ/RimL family protein N-acetyltransferase
MSDLVMVRVRQPEHIAELANFASDIFREYFSTLYSAEKVECLIDHLLSTEALTRAIADEGYEYYFVDEEDEHIGFLGIQPHESYLFLSKLYLVKEARGKGYGRAMFNTVKERAKELGCSTIRLNCARDNVASLDYYDHIGFKKVGREDTEIGNGFQMNDFILEYQLS